MRSQGAQATFAKLSRQQGLDTAQDIQEAQVNKMISPSVNKAQDTSSLSTTKETGHFKDNININRPSINVNVAQENPRNIISIAQENINIGQVRKAQEKSQHNTNSPSIKSPSKNCPRNTTQKAQESPRKQNINVALENANTAIDNSNSNQDINIIEVKRRTTKKTVIRNRTLAEVKHVNDTKRTNYIKKMNKHQKLDNLINVNIENKIVNKEKLFELHVVNTCSIRNKTSEMQDYLTEHEPDLCLVSETWLQKKDATLIAELNSNGYKFKNSERKTKKLKRNNGKKSKKNKNKAKIRGGGLGLFCKVGLKMSVVKEEERKFFQYTIWKIKKGKITVNIVGIYRPPTHSQSKFLEEFAEFLPDIAMSEVETIIAGDFNLHCNKNENRYTKQFMELLSNYNMTQHIKFPTHKNGNTLDLVITRETDKLRVEETQQNDFISDHCFIKTKLSMPKTEYIRKEVTYRNMKNIDKDELIKDLKEITRTAEEIDDLDELVETYDRSLKTLLDKHAPEKTKRVTIRPKLVWYDTKLNKLKRIKRNLERKWKQSRSRENWKAFTQARNEYAHALGKAKTIYIKDEVDKCANDSKKMYKLINDMTGGNKENPMPDDQSDSKLANNFADYFEEKIDKIRKELDTFDKYEPDDTCNSNLNNFAIMSEEQIKEIINKSKAKNCELDPIATKIIKEYIDILIPFITKIVNLSLQTGNFTDGWKLAIVKPLLKKVGLELLNKNYRPVSNLSFLSKIVEKASLKQLNEYVQENELQPDYQSAYREFYSTETVLIKLTNDILNNMDKQRVTLMAAIDLSAAFDTVDHEILLSVLEKKFGIHGIALQWYKSYLSNRKMKVSINGKYSSDRKLNYSVPQGSCAGPVLYNAYASTMQEIIKKFEEIDVSGYADDHALKTEIKVGTESNEIQRVEKMEEGLNDIDTWMKQNRLKMNGEKTEVIYFGTKPQLKKLTTNRLKVGDQTVDAIEGIGYLGGDLDNNMTMKSFIAKKCRIASYNLYNIAKLRKYLTRDTCSTLMQTLVISHLDYANAILVNLSKKSLQPLQRIQNMAAKITLLRSRDESATEARKELHWLPIEKRIQYKVCLTVHKCRKNEAPKYLQNLLSEKKDTGHSTRQSNEELLEIPKTNKSTFADRSFSVAGPKLYNDLPTNTKEAPSTETFKKRLKTHLFIQAYGP